MYYSKRHSGTFSFHANSSGRNLHNFLSRCSKLPPHYCLRAFDSLSTCITDWILRYSDRRWTSIVCFLDVAYVAWQTTYHEIILAFRKVLTVWEKPFTKIMSCLHLGFVSGMRLLTLYGSRISSPMVQRQYCKIGSKHWQYSDISWLLCCLYSAPSSVNSCTPWTSNSLHASFARLLGKRRENLFDGPFRRQDNFFYEDNFFWITWSSSWMMDIPLNCNIPNRIMLTTTHFGLFLFKMEGHFAHLWSLFQHSSGDTYVA